jgi:glycosyltransferase involved in cell wall biosynthesis
MDNFGPAMPVLGGLFPRVKVTYSAANYQPRGSKRLYDFYLKSSINPIDGAGVYTHAYKAILRDLGIRTPLRMTRWGVNLPDRSMNAEQKETIRSALNQKKGEKFLLWSGFIQQIKDHDFFATIKVAHKVVKNNPKINFLFAFKPESYRPEFANEANEKIKVATNIENFTDILEAADFFLSPVGNELSTVSPPLTWIEALSRGTPVITTSVGGANEVVIHKKTGYLAKDYESLEDIIHKAVNDSDLDEMAMHAKTLVREVFNLQTSAKAYQEFWEEMIG